MKPLSWDSINPITGTPFTWDDPNLRWGDPAYYLEPGDPGFVPYGPQPTPKPVKKKKPFRRAPRPVNPEPTPTPQTMSTFKYNVAPNSNGGFTTRAARVNPVSTTSLLGMVATDAGTTPEQAESVLRAFFGKVLACSAGCDWSPDFLGLVSFRPTSGGSSSLPNGFRNPDDINADIALSFTAETIRQWRSTLSIESLGEVGKVTPSIETVIRQSDGAVNMYQALGLVEVRGNHLNFTPSDVAQGIFLKAGAAPEVRVTQYANISPQSVVILIPSGLTGPLNVRVASFINGSVRTATYTDVITDV